MTIFDKLCVDLLKLKISIQIKNLKIVTMQHQFILTVIIIMGKYKNSNNLYIMSSNYDQFYKKDEVCSF